MSADELRKMADEVDRAASAATFEAVCQVVGVGVTTVQSRERTRDTAKRRAVVAWVLQDKLEWPPAKVAAALNRTPRAVRMMLRQERC